MMLTDFRENNMDKYPMHAKLKPLQDKSQAIHEFVLWLQETHGIFLASWLRSEEDEQKILEGYISELRDHISVAVPNNKRITDLVAEYYEIDQTQLENEKREMLDECRAANEAKDNKTQTT